MRGPSVLRVVVVLLLTGGPVVIPVVLPAGAAAQPTTCPTTRNDVATVALAAPEAGATVSGRVEVHGRVEAPTALFQVELFVGDSRKDVSVFPQPVTEGEFALAWDASRVLAGAATLRVVACGGSADGDSLISGTATVDVQVEASSTPAPTRVLVDAPPPATRDTRSLTAGAVIAVPAVAGLLFAVGRRRRA